MRAQMPAPRQTIAAASTHYMTFAADDIAGMKIVDIRSRLDDLAHELMPDRHRHRNGALRPVVPFINVDVGSANSRPPHANEDVVNSRPRRFDVFEP